MSAVEKVNRFLAEIGTKAGTTLELEDGVCAILFEERQECIVEVADEAGIVSIRSPIMPLPDDSRDELLLHLLALNYDGTETAGCAVGYNSLTNELVLGVTRGADQLDLVAFENLVGNIVSAATALAEKLTAEFVHGQTNDEVGLPTQQTFLRA